MAESSVVTRLVNGFPMLAPDHPSGPSGRPPIRSPIRDRRPRLFPVSSRSGVPELCARRRVKGMVRPSRSGAGDGRRQGRTVRGTDVPRARRHHPRHRGNAPGALAHHAAASPSELSEQVELPLRHRPVDPEGIVGGTQTAGRGCVAAEEEVEEEPAATSRRHDPVPAVSAVDGEPLRPDTPDVRPAVGRVFVLAGLEIPAVAPLPRVGPERAETSRGEWRCRVEKAEGEFRRAGNLPDGLARRRPGFCAQEERAAQGRTLR